MQYQHRILRMYGPEYHCELKLDLGYKKTVTAARVWFEEWEIQKRPDDWSSRRTHCTMRFYQPSANPILVLIVITFISCAIGIAVHYWIEKPLVNYVQRKMYKYEYKITHV